MIRDRWKRAGLAIVSAIVAEAFVGAFIASKGSLNLWGEQMFGFLYFASILVVPGWLVALPIILHDRFGTLHRWQQILIGTMIGPIIVALVAIYGSLTSGAESSYSSVALNFVYIALGVSFLTSVIYVTTLKFLIFKSYVSKSS